MSKLKVNPNLAAVLVLVGLFAGWQYMIWAVLFVFLCEDDENLKSITIKTIALLAACYLFQNVWNLIEGGYGVIYDIIKGIFIIIQSIDETVLMPSFITILFTSILGTVVSIIGSIISLLILFTKISFVISVISNKAFNKPFSKIDEYLTLFTNYILGKINPQPSYAYQQPAAPVNPTPVSQATQNINQQPSNSEQNQNVNPNN